MISSASDKAKLFAENFSKKTFLPLPTFPSRTNLKLHINSVIPTMVNKVKKKLNLSNACDPNCIPVVVLENCGVLLRSLAFQIVGGFHQ